MSDFEKIYQTDPLREFDHKREMHESIEISDQMIKKEWVYREFLNELPKILINSDIAEVQINEGIKNEKSKDKNVKGKSKKNNSKLHKSTVESLQG